MKKSAKVKQLNINFYYLIPIIFAAAIIPLVVYMNVIPVDKITFPFWTGEKENIDFFSYSKAFFIRITGLISIIFIFVGKYQKKLTIKPVYEYYIPMCVYALFAILSSIFSKFQNTVKQGFVDRFEGIYVLLAYLILMFIAINFINNDKHARYLLGAVLISAIIIGVIGVFQFIGYDFFKTDFAKQLTIPSKYQHLSKNLEFRFNIHTIYSTLYNTNYVGSYMAMLFPITLTLAVLIKKNIYKIGMGIISSLMLINLFGCRSRAGLVGGVVAFLIMLILIRKSLISNIKYVIGIVCLFALIFVGLNTTSNGEIVKRIAQSLESLKSSFGRTKASNMEIEDIIINGKKVSIVTGKNSLNLELVDSQIIFSDSNDKTLVLNTDASGNMTIKENDFSAFKFKMDTEQNVLNINFGAKKLSFYIHPAGFEIVGERGITLEDIERPESVLFNDKEKMGSGRGYIWSRSIPLLKKTAIIGSGPDTYAFMFPQHDYVGKLKAFDRVDEIVDKPHNLYLQIGINTGVISLLSVLVLFIIYFISCIRLYIKGNFKNDTEIMGVAVFTGFIGYVVTAFFNDSLVSVAPVFWVIFGIGVSLNYRLGNEFDKAGKVKLKAARN